MATAGSPANKGRHRIFTPKRILILAGVLLLPLLVFAAYTGMALSWSYSEGERAGVLQKFSLRGWICKTYEGELAMTTSPGVAPMIWQFSVRDESVIPKINAAIGQHVILSYDEHRGVPSSCFGNTPYFVTDVVARPVD